MPFDGPDRARTASSRQQAKPHFNPFDPSGPVRRRARTRAWTGYSASASRRARLAPAAAPFVATREGAGPAAASRSTRAGRSPTSSTNSIRRVTTYRFDAGDRRAEPLQILSDAARHIHRQQPRRRHRDRCRRAHAVRLEPRATTASRVFRIDPASGLLELRRRRADGAARRASSRLSPDGRLLFALNEDSDIDRRLRRRCGDRPPARAAARRVRVRQPGVHGVLRRAIAEVSHERPDDFPPGSLAGRRQRVCVRRPAGAVRRRGCRACRWCCACCSRTCVRTCAAPSATRPWPRSSAGSTPAPARPRSRSSPAAC